MKALILLFIVFPSWLVAQQTSNEATLIVTVKNSYSSARSDNYYEIGNYDRYVEIWDSVNGYRTEKVYIDETSFISINDETGKIYKNDFEGLENRKNMLLERGYEIYNLKEIMPNVRIEIIKLFLNEGWRLEDIALGQTNRMPEGKLVMKTEFIAVFKK